MSASTTEPTAISMAPMSTPGSWGTTRPEPSTMSRAAPLPTVTAAAPAQ
ncbi:MAG TPA: hypothetical protein VFW24_15780 [Acidimicrobiales bacterium]|nr:hypothetical protein [Acidimicrobiales bacterium]